MGPRRNVGIVFGSAKTRAVWLIDGEKSFDDILSRFDRIPACNGRTDGHLATA